MKLKMMLEGLLELGVVAEVDDELFVTSKPLLFPRFGS